MSDAFNTYTTDWKDRIQSVIRLAVLISGGVMSITIGMFIGNESFQIPKDAIPFIRFAWYSLAVSLSASLMLPFVIAVSGGLVLRKYKKHRRSNNAQKTILDSPWYIYAAGWALLTTAVAGCVVGLGLMVWGAGFALQTGR